MNLAFSVTKQIIARTDSEIVIEHSINYLFAGFTFSADWAGLSKVAILKKLVTGTELQIPLVNDAIAIPAEMINQQGDFSVSVYGGSAETQLITANVALVAVGPSGFHLNDDEIYQPIVLDGTADPDDVIIGETFYKDDPNEKLTGTLELTGDATPADVLDGKFFYKDDPKVKLEGTLVPQTELTGDAVPGDVRDGKFFYSDDPDEKLEGTLALTGDAIAGNVLDGKFFYSDDLDTKLEGTMPDRAGDNEALSAEQVGTVLHLVAPDGHYDGVDDNVYYDIGYELVPLEDHDAFFSEIFVTRNGTPSLLKMRLFDLAILGKMTTYNDQGNSREIIFSTYNEDDRILGAIYNFNVQWFRAQADLSDYQRHGTVEYAAYGYSVDQCEADDQFIYVGTGNGKLHKVDKDDIILNGDGSVIETAYGGAVLAVCCFGDDVNGWFIFIGGATTKKVFKYDYDEVDGYLPKLAESADYGGTINALAQDGTHLFGGGATTQKVYKYDPADLSKLAESASLGSDIKALACDSTHIYAGLADGYIYKLLKSDLSTVDSEECYTGAINVLKEYRSYLYIGGDTTEKVYKIRKSDLSVYKQSPDLGSTIYGLALGSVVET